MSEATLPLEPESAAPPRYAEVAVDQPGSGLDRTLTYSLPPRLAGRVQVGSWVRVPLGRRRVAGYVVGLPAEPPPVRLREVEELLAEEPLFGPPELELARRVARDYLCPLLPALRLLLPPGATRRAEQQVTLTDAGRAALHAGEPARAPRRRELLQALAEAGGEADRAELERGRQPGADVGAALRHLQEQGWVELQGRLGPPGAARRTARWVRLAGDSDAAAEAGERLSRTAPRQAELLELLRQAGPRPLAQTPPGAARALAARGLVEIYEEQVQRRPQGHGLGLSPERWQPTPAQALVLERVREALDAGRYWGGLLHGVTGSGKTEVYLHGIETALAHGRSAIVLVPEISLTPQTVERFTAWFGDQVAVLHSSLGRGERYDEWQRVQAGAARVVIGARSALFAPCREVGVIIVDEEHEASYKQDSAPRYQAVTVAQWRAREQGAVLLLGSATPSLERYHAAQNPADDSLHLVELPERIGGRPLPVVRTLDLRGETVLGPGRTLAEELEQALAERLERGEQVMLFLNRRGYSTFVICRDCGFVLRCPDCAVSLIYHHSARRARCHHCEYSLAAPEQCPNCEGYNLDYEGLGTERIADQVQRRFPAARLLRLDRDTVSRRGAYGRILGQFARGEAQVLIGTQMIAKGHDFPEVTLVGVINADVGLHRPDFRAAERTFQLLTQVSGRAGRANKPGEVYVQTYNPDHYALQAAAQHDFRRFYDLEIGFRAENLYPPFTCLAHLVFSHQQEQAAQQAAREAAIRLQALGWQHRRGAEQFLGPAPCPLLKLRGCFRYHLLLKAPRQELLSEGLETLLADLDLPGDLRVTADVDPQDLM